MAIILTRLQIETGLLGSLNLGVISLSNRFCFPSPACEITVHAVNSLDSLYLPNSLKGLEKLNPK